MFRQWKYKFKRWFFRWIADESGCIGLMMCGGVVTFLKYKDSTIVYWFRKFPTADRWHGHERPECKINLSA